MISIRHASKALLAHRQLFGSLLLLLSVALGYVAHQYPLFTDFTQNQRNSLSRESVNALQAMQAPIKIQALAGNDAGKGKYFRKSILAFMTRYQRYKSNIEISFLSPDSDMSQAREIGLQQEGDWLVTYKNQSEYFKLPYTEEHFTNLLIKLQSNKDQSFFFTDGHLEPKLNGAAKKEGGHFANVLKENGIQFEQAGQLAKLNQSHILVINAPKKPFSREEVDLVQHHINAGNNLIWLIDSPDLQGLAALADTLNIDVSEGVAVDLSNKQLGSDPQLVSASNYARHEIFSDFSIRTFFPNARRVVNKAEIGTTWKSTQLIGVAENGWLTKSTPDQLSPEELTKNVARSGPVNIALALERSVKNHPQRILVIGSSEFLSNESLEKGGNLALALKMFKWAQANHTSISLKPSISRDSVVIISSNPINRYLILTIFNGFQFALPALLFFAAFYVWFRRSKM